MGLGGMGSELCVDHSWNVGVGAWDESGRPDGGWLVCQNRGWYVRVGWGVGGRRLCLLRREVGFVVCRRLGRLRGLRLFYSERYRG